MTEDPAVAMKELHDDHASALWGFCLHLTGNDRARAEDVAQETMLRAWRNASVLTETRGSVRSWLFTVARNIVIDEWRTRGAPGEFPTAEPPETDPHRRRDRRAAVVLGGRRRAEHRSPSSTARSSSSATTGAARWPRPPVASEIPEGTVKSRTHYALRALRLALEEMGVVA